MTLALVLLLPTTDLAYGQEDHIKACYATWPPFSYQSNGKAKGLSIEIYQNATKRAGLSVSFHKLPWKRCRGSSISGEYQAIVDGGVRTPNTLGTNQYPIIWVQMFWVHKNSSHTEFRSYHQFKDQRIGFTRAYEYPSEFYEFKGFKSKIPSNSDLLGLKMLHAGRIDTFHGDLVNCRYLAERYQLDITPLYPASKAQGLTLRFSEGNRHQHERFETALKQMFTDGSIDTLYRKHLGLTYQEFLNHASHPEKELSKHQKESLDLRKKEFVRSYSSPK